MASQRNRTHARRSRNWRRFSRLYRLLSVVLILVAIVVACTIFFRVETITVEGNQRYTDEEIISITGIQQGDNLFALNKYRIINSLLEELPYISSVSIRRTLPESITITVTETEATVCIQSGDSWWLTDSTGRLLERLETADESVIQVTGVELLAPSEGTTLGLGTDYRLQEEGLLELLAALESRGLLEKITSIDLSSASTVTMIYNGQLEVLMNLADDFDYDVKVLLKVEEKYISVNWGSGDSGTLDLTGSQPHLTRNT